MGQALLKGKDVLNSFSVQFRFTNFLKIFLESLPNLQQENVPKWQSHNQEGLGSSRSLSHLFQRGNS